jgi:fluoride exporter
MITYFWVALGSALGGMARYWCTGLVAARFGDAFPWGTIAINVVGSFVIGVFATLTALDGRFPVAADARIFVMVGLCGGFTTFSAFSLQTLDLLRAGNWAGAGGNVLFSVLLCLIAVWAGHLAAGWLSAARGA